LTLEGKNSGFEIGAAVILGIIVIICLLLVPLLLISKRMRPKKQEVGTFKLKDYHNAGGQSSTSAYEYSVRGLPSARAPENGIETSNYPLGTSSNLIAEDRRQSPVSQRNNEVPGLNGMQADEEDYPDS
jgi:hypothetical protein